MPYCNDAGSHAAKLIESKILFNNIILDAKHGACFMTLDLKDHFLASPMTSASQRYIPPDIMKKYILCTKKKNNYCKIKKGIYGLKQAALLAYNFLKKVPCSP